MQISLPAATVETLSENAVEVLRAHIRDNPAHHARRAQLARVERMAALVKAAGKNRVTIDDEDFDTLKNLPAVRHDAR